MNIVLQYFTLVSRLHKVDVPLPSIEGFYSKKGYYYSIYKVTLHLADSTGAECRTEHVFFRVDLNKADLLLGRPWRRQFGVIVNSRTDYWWYAEKGELPAIRIREVYTFRKDLRKATLAFLVTINKVGDVKIAPLPEELQDFADVIADGNMVDCLLPDSVDYAIDLELGTKPLFRLLYNLSNCKLKVLREYLEQAQKNRWIR